MMKRIITIRSTIWNNNFNDHYNHIKAEYWLISPDTVENSDELEILSPMIFHYGRWNEVWCTI